MTQASTNIYYFYSKFINYLFNVMEIQTGVTIGWIIVTCVVFGILINAILSIPKLTPHISETTTINDNSGTTKSFTYYDEKTKTRTTQNHTISKNKTYSKRRNKI